MAQNIFNGCVSSASGSTGKWLVLNHDVHYTTVTMLAEYEIKRGLALGYKCKFYYSLRIYTQMLMEAFLSRDRGPVHG